MLVLGLQVRVRVRKRLMVYHKLPLPIASAPQVHVVASCHKSVSVGKAQEYYEGVSQGIVVGLGSRGVEPCCNGRLVNCACDSRIKN